MFESNLDVIREMTPEDAKAFVLALGDYSLYGKEPELEGMAKIAFISSKVNQDNAIARYEKCIENGKKGAEFGKKGGRPRKGESKEEYLKRKGLETPKETPRNNQENLEENGLQKPQEKPLYVDEYVYDDVDKDEDIIKEPTLNNNYISKEKEIITTNINNLVIKESGGFEKGGFDSCFEDEEYYEKQDGNLVFHNGSYAEEQELNYWG